MFPILIKMYTIMVLTILALSSVTGNSSIQPELNPGCTECKAKEPILVYVKAKDDGVGYVVHQLWDFTGHVPTLFYIIGTENSTVKVAWDGNKPQAIVAEDSFYSFALILNNLIEYNDTDINKVAFSYSYPHRDISLRDVTWRLDESVLTPYKAKVRVCGDLSWERHHMNGTIDIKLLLVPFTGRSPSLPRLYHSVNTTQVDIALAGLATRYPAPRLAARYVLVSQDAAAAALRYSERKSIDDEYTPGVFETINVMTPRSLGGFLQFRPVAYTQRLRDVENSVDAFVHPYNRTKIPRDCLVEKYYTKFDEEDVFINELVASFGQTGDGFYKKTNYTVWTYSVGYGLPPTEGASIVLIVLLVLAIATPIVGIICSFAVSSRMLRRHRQSLLEEA